jgi:hypothetical protein
MRRLYPDKRFSVIYSDKSHEKNILKIGALPYFYQSKATDEELLSGIAQNTLFREGFWRFSLERLLALEAWHMSAASDSPMLHLESDILTFENFPFDEMAKLEKLSWIQVTESHDVSAILFSPSLQQTRWLTESIREELTKDPKLTDMTVLNIVRRQSPDLVTLLPTLEEPTSTVFLGVFDGASIGMWMTGRDPRNHLGVIRRHLKFEDALDRAGLAEYTLSHGKLYSTNSAGKYPIYNLHVHSKRTNLFKYSNQTALRMDLLRIKFPILSTTFSPYAAWAVLVDYYRRHGFRLNRKRLIILFNIMKPNNREN